MPQLLRVPLGGGLDRYPGPINVQPGAMQRLENVIPYGVKLQLRRGTQSVQWPARALAHGGAPCSHIVCVQAVRTHTEGLVVGYYQTTQQVHVWRVSGTGEDPTYVGQWGSDTAWGGRPPVVISEESYGHAFLAHDEPRVGHRAPTQVYDATAGTLTTLTADLDGTGAAPVRFRGVVAWLSYLIGWGFGTPGDERPEIVRASKPGEPTEFDRDHYWIAGDRGAPVLSCAKAGGVLLVLKPTDTYRVTGTSPFNFGIVPQFAIQGCVGSRLAVTVDSVCYSWGIRGPWRTAGSTAGDIAPPLDLPDKTPTDPDQGFAFYDPIEEVIEWHFGRDVYALVLKGGQTAWSTRTRPFESFAAGFLYGSVGLHDPSGDQPTGYPEMVGVDDTEMTWRNVGADGDETLEVYLRQGQDGWERNPPDVDVTTAPTQSRDVPDIVAGVPYDLAVRYRRGGLYDPAYRDPNPDNWPAHSRYSSLRPITPLGKPAVSSASWSRVGSAAEQITLTFRPVADDLPHVVQRDGTSVGTVQAGQVIFIDTSPRPEQYNSYTVVAHTPSGLEGTPSLPKRVWAGPDPPLSVLWRRIAIGPGPEPAPGGVLGEDEYQVSWRSQVAESYFTEVQADTGIPHRFGAGVRQATIDAEGTAPLIKVRTVTVHFGVEDYSAWITAGADAT